MARIMIVDDEADFRKSVAEVLREAGHDVEEFETADDAVEILKKSAFDVVLADLRMPGMSGLDLLKEAAVRLPDSIRIVMTAYGSMDAAIEAMRADAEDFLLKPVNLSAFKKKLDAQIRRQAMAAENRFLRKALGIDAPPTGLVGESEGIKGVQRLIDKVASKDTTVLILGETGTGKELVARAIHHTSQRSEEPFVTINCGSIPENLLESELFGHVRGSFTGADRDKRGLFEVSGTGTIFLDEIGEMPSSLQPKLLRVLENREIMRVGSTSPIRVHSRVVAATHRTLSEMIQEGKFRSDLYYRLNVFEISIPPVRERSQDIRLIAEHLLDRICTRMNHPGMQLDDESAKILQRYSWPGNVRELANVLERAVILSEGNRITIADLPGIVSSATVTIDDDLKTARQQFERNHIVQIVGKCGGDKRKAAQALGVDLSSLYRKLQENPAAT